MRKNNLILIGMPGCGKSYICSMLASALPDYIAVDTDKVIEDNQRMTIAEVFAKYSESYFRELETEAILKICTGSNKIIATGGGTFENARNREVLMNFGTVFYLKSDIDVLYNRISQEKTRPLLNCENPKQVLKNLLNQREHNYSKAHYVVDTNSLSPEEIVRFILGSINETNPSC